MERWLGHTVMVATEELKETLFILTFGTYVLFMFPFMRVWLLQPQICGLIETLAVHLIMHDKILLSVKGIRLLCNGRQNYPLYGLMSS